MHICVKALELCQKNGIPMVVAINKCDLDGVDPQRVRQVAALCTHSCARGCVGMLSVRPCVFTRIYSRYRYLYDVVCFLQVGMYAAQMLSAELNGTFSA
jgi:hypothetical protein